jgi:hypothetical protein
VRASPRAAALRQQPCACGSSLVLTLLLLMLTPLTLLPLAAAGCC